MKRKSQMYRMFTRAMDAIVKETNKRIKETGRPQTKQDVSNDMIESYSVLLRKIDELQGINISYVVNQSEIEGSPEHPQYNPQSNEVDNIPF